MGCRQLSNLLIEIVTNAPSSWNNYFCYFTLSAKHTPFRKYTRLASPFVLSLLIARLTLSVSDTMNRFSSVSHPLSVAIFERNLASL